MDVEIDPLQGILTGHLTCYPSMQVQDVYKLLHQAALGSGHAVHDEQAARDWLMRELANMGTGPDDPLMDPLSPDGQILRIHLRPYLRAGKSPETLLRAFIQTTNDWRGSLEKLTEYAAVAAQLADIGIGSIRREKIETFFAKMEEQDFPAMHHSAVYARLYRPAYRVVAKQYLEDK